MDNPRRLIIAITGATGAVYGVRMLQMMQAVEAWETHLIISSAGLLNLQHELNMSRREVHVLADVAHDIHAIGANIASGSFKTEGMIIAPCSMKTLASVAHGFADNLITRAADVILKERRKLLVLPRETPLNLAHIRNMASITEMGGIIFPPLPPFYLGNDSLASLVNESCGRVLNLAGVEQENLFQQWPGIQQSSK